MNTVFEREGTLNRRVSAGIGFRLVLAWVLLSLLASAANARQLYRYRNVEGNVVVDYQVPSHYVGSGYEILNDDGIVIKVVPRELTLEERQAKDAAIAEEARLREWDKLLLLRYSTIADIEAARDRALGDLEIRLSILKGNRRALKQKVENYQAQAADMERAGMAVDVERLRAIESLQGEIGLIDRSIVEREKEIGELKNLFQLDIERFETLLEVVELRKSTSAPGGKGGR